MQLVSDPALSAAMLARHAPARLTLGFSDDHGTTRLTERSHFGPLRVQKALYPEAPAVCHAIIVHPPGGVVGGDQLQINANVGIAAHALLTTPGAAKWYKAKHTANHAATSQQQIQLKIASGAALEWLPQETIFFNHAQVQLQHHVELAADARYIGAEILCFGRTASGERFDSGCIAQHNTIRRAGQLIWWEQGTLDGAGDGMHSILALGGYTVCATLTAVGPPLSAALLGRLRQIGHDEQKALSGASQIKSVLMARYLGHSSAAARQWISACWQLLRPELLGREAVIPRIWNT